MEKRVALLVTCLVDQIMPEIGVATVKILRHAGYEVDFPQNQTCCGQPFFNSGFQSQAISLARRTIAIFEPYAAVVLPSGSCTTMLRIEYPHLFADDPEWSQRAQALAAKTFELSEFLVSQAKWQPPDCETPQAITYHDSCHMNRLLGLKDEPRQLLQQAGCNIQEMSESDRCCGFGGLFSLRLPEVSNAMTEVKLAAATETETAVLVTADPGCLMQMRGLGQAAIQTEHLATILGRRLTNEA